MWDQELTHLLAPDQQERSAPRWLGLSGGAALQSFYSSPGETKAVSPGGCAGLEGLELPPLSASGDELFRPAARGCLSGRDHPVLKYRLDASVICQHSPARNASLTLLRHG